MKGTKRRFTAYNKLTMEIILLLLFALSDKDGNMKRSLQQFLSFYKENRELLKMLADTVTHQNQAPAPAQNESRPQNEIGSLNILEDYLRRVNA